MSIAENLGVAVLQKDSSHRVCFPYQDKQGVCPPPENRMPGFCSQCYLLFHVIQWNFTITIKKKMH